MALFLIGIGLSDEKDISVKGLEFVKKADVVYLEHYTSVLQVSVKKLEEFYGKKIILADRAMVEGDENEILKNAKTKDVAFLVVGDIFSATTHMDLYRRAQKEKISVSVVHNASVMTAVGAAGLQLYKYGKTTSIPFAQDNFVPETPYLVIKDNQKLGYHTLLLLDLRPEEKRFMTVAEGIAYLLALEKKRGEKVFTEETRCVGCARLGSKDQRIISGTAKEILKKDFGKPPHCLIVPGKMHFMEEEVVLSYK